MQSANKNLDEECFGVSTSKIYKKKLKEKNALHPCKYVSNVMDFFFFFNPPLLLFVK